jgi:hypothetical protein
VELLQHLCTQTQQLQKSTQDRITQLVDEVSAAKDEGRIDTGRISALTLRMPHSRTGS